MEEQVKGNGREGGLEGGNVGSESRQTEQRGKGGFALCVAVFMWCGNWRRICMSRSEGGKEKLKIVDCKESTHLLPSTHRANE